MSPIPRILALALSLLGLAYAPLDAQSTVRTGSLAASDPRLDSGEHFDEYTIDVPLGQELIVILSAVDFDPYLLVYDPAGELHENDDYADSPNVALVQQVAGSVGTWRIRATSYESDETGDYALVLTTRQRTDAGETDEQFAVQGDVPEDPAATIEGTLGEGDSRRQDDSFYEGWALMATEGQHVVLTMRSPVFDTYLTFVSPTGRTFNDDDGGGNTDSRIDIVIDEPGRWIVVANSLEAGDTGAYTLTIER